MPGPSRGLGRARDDELQQLPWTVKKRHLSRVQSHEAAPRNVMAVRLPCARSALCWALCKRGKRLLLFGVF